MSARRNPGAGQATGALESTATDPHQDTVPGRPADEISGPIARLRAEAAEYGFVLACRCLDCRRPLTAATSLAHVRGPVCRGHRGGAA